MLFHFINPLEACRFVFGTNNGLECLQNHALVCIFCLLHKHKKRLFHYLSLFHASSFNVCDVNDVCGHVKSACFCVLQNVSVCLDHVLNIFLSFLEIVP